MVRFFNSIWRWCSGKKAITGAVLMAVGYQTGNEGLIELGKILLYGGMGHKLAKPKGERIKIHVKADPGRVGVKNNPGKKKGNRK